MVVAEYVGLTAGTVSLVLNNATASFQFHSNEDASSLRRGN